MLEIDKDITTINRTVLLWCLTSLFGLSVIPSESFATSCSSCTSSSGSLAAEEGLTDATLAAGGPESCDVS